MFQLSAWLVVMSSVLGATEPGSTEDEGSNIAADIFAATDIDKNGVLKHPEIRVAREKVFEKMQATMPKFNYISGGQKMAPRMLQRLLQDEIDVDRNAEVDQRELAIFVNNAILLREHILRTPLMAQHQIMREESAGKITLYSRALEKERRMKERAKYDMHWMAHQQNQGVLFDAKLVRDILRSQMAVEMAAKRKAEEATRKAAEEKKPADDKPTPAPPEPKSPQG
jgi:hypothetical protein